MATIGGGAVLIGVRDDGRLIGLNVGRVEVERLVQQVLAQTDPKVYVDADQVTVDGKRLLRIAVPPGDGPHLAFGRAFHRAGRATVAMTRDEYERRLQEPRSTRGPSPSPRLRSRTRDPSTACRLARRCRRPAPPASDRPVVGAAEAAGCAPGPCTAHWPMVIPSV